MVKRHPKSSQVVETDLPATAFKTQRERADYFEEKCDALRAKISKIQIAIEEAASIVREVRTSEIEMTSMKNKECE